MNNENLTNEEIEIINNISNQISNLIQSGKSAKNIIPRAVESLEYSFGNQRLIPIEVKEKIQKRLSNLYAKKNILNNELIKYIIAEGSQKNFNEKTRIKCLANKNVKYRNFKNKLQDKIGIGCDLVNSIKNFRAPEKKARSTKYRCITPSLEKVTNQEKNRILTKITNQNWLTNQFQAINEEILETPNNLICSSNESTTRSVKSMPSNIRPINNPHYTRPTTASEARSRPSTAPKTTLRRYGGKKRTTSTKGKKAKKRTSTKSKKAKKRVQKK